MVMVGALVSCGRVVGGTKGTITDDDNCVAKNKTTQTERESLYRDRS